MRGLLDRSATLIPDVAPSTTALLLFATRAGRRTEAFMRVMLAERNLDTTEFSMLFYLWFSKDPSATTMGDLASAVVLSQPGVTRAVQRAERKGLIRKLPDPDDLRAVTIELTASGRQLIEETMTFLLQRFEERLDRAFSDTQMLTLADAAAQYAVAMGAASDPGERT